jgi:hypothetical protein
MRVLGLPPDGPFSSVLHLTTGLFERVTGGSSCPEILNGSTAAFLVALVFFAAGDFLAGTILPVAFFFEAVTVFLAAFFLTGEDVFFEEDFFIAAVVFFGADFLPLAAFFFFLDNFLVAMR